VSGSALSVARRSLAHSVSADVGALHAALSREVGVATEMLLTKAEQVSNDGACAAASRLFGSAAASLPLFAERGSQIQSAGMATMRHSSANVGSPLFPRTRVRGARSSWAPLLEQGRTGGELTAMSFRHASGHRPSSTRTQREEVDMAESNNHLAGQLPAEPYPELHQLDRLVGKWEATGGFLEGFMTFEWMEGGFFFIQHVDAYARGRHIKGTEYIGFDEDTQTLRSHYMDVHGANFTYTWEIDGDKIRTWFGEKDSDNHFEGQFSEDGDSYAGAWQWPGGGYQATLTRVS
jgi:hypothetical protein